MRFKGRQMPDWQQQVWDAKDRIYQGTKGKSFREYLKDIRRGADAFRAEGQTRHPTSGPT